MLFIEPRGHKHVVRLKSGESFHHPRCGHISHDRVIGRPPGVLLLTESGLEVSCLRLTLEHYILKRLRRKTTIIHPKDLAPLLLSGNLYPGARVLEAGCGSGAASITLLRFLGGKGCLISCERRPEFLELTAANVTRANELFGDPGTEHRLEECDVYQRFPAADLDLVLLDLPEPQRAAEHAADTLRPGAVLLCWLPTVTQVYAAVRELQRQPKWGDIEVRERLEREWKVAENAMRPHHKMVGHTGFLVRARRLSVAGAYGQ